MKSPFLDFWAKMPAAFYRALLARIVMFVVFAGSVAIIWWNVAGIGWVDGRLENWAIYRFQSMEKLLQRENARQAQLADDTSDFEMKWDRNESNRVAMDFKLALEQTFTNRDEPKPWLEAFKRQPNQFLLDVKAQTGRTQACPLPNKV